MLEGTSSFCSDEQSIYEKHQMQSHPTQIAIGCTSSAYGRLRNGLKQLCIRPVLFVQVKTCPANWHVNMLYKTSVTHLTSFLVSEFIIITSLILSNRITQID